MEDQVERIRAVISRVLGVEPERVGPDTSFLAELGADSMMLIELLANLEIEYDIEVDESELAHLVDLQSVLDVLARARQA
ncbi:MULTISPECIES: phosphopantetheine-binding protein [unclassified Crossiella]|uniref:acyl carrier protein n=1 Tax=unclassified Crossiella TaxID=2620835 RepID=UPI001FFE4A55|nr:MULTISPECIES: phosphopantetheine-binding protein [unclassified Crossiella]MCK2236911.1 phosphopantetheine-binding protein [Crossiella sp. S99.2]MCK2250579.1 phosphopantetheine-binding protein [Crossiella sp. S99.1]